MINLAIVLITYSLWRSRGCAPPSTPFLTPFRSAQRNVRRYLKLSQPLCYAAAPCNERMYIIAPAGGLIPRMRQQIPFVPHFGRAVRQLFDNLNPYTPINDLTRRPLTL